MLISLEENPNIYFEMKVCIYIYIYIYIEREREREIRKLEAF